MNTIIFDMDGVLINSEPMHFQIWKQLFGERGIALDYPHYKGCIGSTVKFLMELIYQGYGKDFRGDPSISEQFRELKNEYIALHGIPEIEGVCQVIPQLKENGFRLAVASSSPQEYIELCMEKLGIASCFDLLFSGERVTHPKPAPDIFLTTANMLGAAPGECVVVEDSTNGTRAAKAAGMTCLGFRNPDSGPQDLSAADEIFYPFSQLMKFSDRCFNPRSVISQSAAQII